MAKKCDNKSVGMLFWKNDELLLIERKRFPFGFAPPAGHVDDDVSFEDAAIRELKEETGLEAEDIKLIIEGRKDNPCRRGGQWHYWKIYEVKVKGELKLNKDETKQIAFVPKNILSELAQKTELYNKGKISENDWEKTPGIERVWLDWFKELKII